MRSLLMLVALGCSGRSQPAPPPEDAGRVTLVADAAAEAAIDAPARFVITERRESYETFVDVHPRGASCPNLDWRRRAKTVAIERCLDRPLGEQTQVLRDLVAYVRGVDPSFDQARLVGSVDFLSYPEFARRLVAYARRVPYDKTQSLHAYVVAAAASEDMLGELAAIFQRRPRLTSVEKCSSGRASQRGEIGAFLRAQGVTGNREIPVGCLMAWFVLEP